MTEYLIPHEGQSIKLNYTDDVNELCSIACQIKGIRAIFDITGHVFDRKKQALSVEMERRYLNSDGEIIGNIEKVTFDAVKQESIAYFSEMATPRMIESESKMTCNGALIYLFNGLLAFDPVTGQFLHDVPEA